MPSADLLQLALLEVRVHLDLVDGWRVLAPLEQRLEVLGHDVADADRAHAALAEQPLERAVGAERAIERARQRLVQEQQVDRVDAELRRALLEPVQRLVVAVVADPQLRGMPEPRMASPTSRSLP